MYKPRNIENINFDIFYLDEFLRILRNKVSKNRRIYKSGNCLYFRLF